ncbi:MAG: SRPBCC domain-containing protein [Pseudomonadota bacterium]
MKSYQVTRTIAALPEAIWPVLTDPERLAAPGMGIVSLTGEIRAGARIRLVSEADPKRSFSIRIDEASAPTRMVWSSGLPFGLFRGVRTFTLTPVAGGTAFDMREVYTGVMLPLIWPSIPDLQPSFDTFATGLAEQVEKSTCPQ